LKLDRSGSFLESMVYLGNQRHGKDYSNDRNDYILPKHDFSVKILVDEYA